MDTNNKITTRGIVVKQTRYKESSKILNIFTKTRGKINVFVPGALRPTSGLMLVTEKFVESDFTLSLKKNTYYIEKAEIIESNLDLGLDPKRFIIADIICEIIDLAMAENQVDPKAYDLLIKTFEFLKDKNTDPDLINLGFMIKFISHIGFKPNLENCSLCGRKNFSQLYFSNANGGLVCQDCLKNFQDCVKLNKSSYQALLGLLYSKYEEFHKFKFDKDLKISLHRLIYGYLIYNIEVDGLKSQRRYEMFFGI
ncbi:MAG: DNA repair protein RecO [Bacillota bacterium]|nr:DNA repair protein RecO [Bacillota bacterium]